jgi:hypothetical protein
MNAQQSHSLLHVLVCFYLFQRITTGTIFHHCKFPISKAFYIAYNVCRGTEEISTYEFARRLSLRQMKCWNFKAKIQNGLGQMDSISEKDKLTFQQILAG